MTTIDRLRQLHEQATDAPWRVIHDNATPDTNPHTVRAYVGRFRDAWRTAAECDGSVQGQQDAELIAAMRNHLPALLDIAEAAQRRAVTHALHVAAASAAASHDQQYLDVINALFAALARLEQP